MKKNITSEVMGLYKHMNYSISHGGVNMLIQIDNLAYKNKEIIKNTTMEIQQGEFIHLLGQNGSGKSSLFKALLGSISYKGNIEILPSDIAIVSDYAKVPKELRVKDVIDFTRQRHEKNIGELVSMLQLEKIQNQRIEKLSSGERRRVELFVALASEKKVIIYDEITNALDQNVKNDLLKFIKAYHAKHDQTAFYTTHNLSESFEIGGRYWLINQNEKRIEDVTCETQENILKKYVWGA